MISEKIIEITKTTTFDKGWALFKPFLFTSIINKHFKEISVTEINRVIDKTKKPINLILSSPCLSSLLVKELSWALQYKKADINLIVKSKFILDKYPKFHDLKNIKVDPNINFSFLHIDGDTSLSVSLSDFYTVTGDEINDYYFNSKSSKTNTEFSSISKIILARSDLTIQDITLIKNASKFGTKCYVLFPIKKFNLELFKKAKENNMEILVGDIRKEGIIAFYKNGNICELHRMNDNDYAPFEIYNSSYYFSHLFVNLLTKEDAEQDKILNDSYCCLDGAIEKTNVKNNIVVNVDCQLPLFSDFVKEKFDSSITGSCDDYSRKARTVTYRFRLIPPKIDNSYKHAKIYDSILSLFENWKNVQDFDLNRLVSNYKRISENESLLTSYETQIVSFNKEIEKIFRNFDFRNYYKILAAVSRLITNTIDGLEGFCLNLFSDISTANSNVTFTKFDDEINGYERTIKIKEDEIKNGINVLSNKSRIVSLKDKIDKLKELKSRFAGSSDSRTDKNHKIFVEHVKKAISGEKFNTLHDSISNVLQYSQGKLDYLYDFIDNNIYSFKLYLDKSLKIIDSLSKERIPTDYVIYEKNNQLFIVIDELDEYKNTQPIQKEYGVLCLTRR